MALSADPVHRLPGRVVLVTPVWPRAEGVGLERRAFQWLATLSARDDVHLIKVGRPGEDDPPMDSQARELTASYQQIDRRPLPGCLPRLLKGQAADWADVDPEKLLETLERLPGSVDRVFVFRFYLHDVGRTLAAHLRCPLSIDLDDWESRTRRSIAQWQWSRRQPFRALRSWLAATRYAKLEQKLLLACDEIHVAASEDADRLSSQLGQREVRAEPNRWAGPIAEQGPVPHSSDPVRILFVGALDYFPNQDAALLLAEEVLPLLPAGRFTAVVAGRRAPTWLCQRLEAFGNVELAVDRDDLSACYRQAEIVVLPLRCGGGTKLKLLEAFSHGRPVVSTSHGIRGTLAADGEHCLVADSAAALAGAIERLANSSALAERLGLAGQDLLARHYLLPRRPCS